MLMCQEIDTFKKKVFHEELYILYSIQYTMFMVKYFKVDLFKKKLLKSINGVCSSEDELKCQWCYMSQVIHILHV